MTYEMTSDYRLYKFAENGCNTDWAIVVSQLGYQQISYTSGGRCYHVATMLLLGHFSTGSTVK